MKENLVIATHLHRLICASIALTALVALSSCQVNPTDSGGWEVTPADGKPKIIPPDRVRRIIYRGRELCTSRGQCWPCEGGTARPCEEWYELIDDYLDSLPSSNSGNENLVLTQASPTNPFFDDHIGVFGTTSELFNAALQADNIAFDSDSVIQGYGLNDTDSGNFVFSFDLVYLDTTEETVDFIFFARSDYALPQTGEGVVVQFLSFPVVSTGGSGTSPLNTALGVRVIGNIGDVKDTMLEMLPAGSTGNWIESNMGDWHFEIVSDGDTHSVNIYLGSNLMGTW